jgi:NDP-sugar pyrophosphorylase family protein
MMFERSLESLPNYKDNLFIFKKKTFFKNNLKNKFLKNKNKSQYYLIDKKTKGMAITIYKAKKLIKLDQPVIISSCDLKCVINYKKFYDVIKKMNPTGIIFTWSQYPPASESPNSHAYVVSKNSIVNKISEKKPISTSPDKDSAVTGIFYFKSGNHLLECIEHSIKNKITVNGEYYIATAMNKLLNEKEKIINFKVDQMISWSLPEHLKDYLFWEEKFTNVKSKV